MFGAMSDINDSKEVEEVDEDRQYTMTNFTIQVSHPLDIGLVEIAKRTAKGIDTDKELTTCYIDSEMNLYA